MKKLSELKGWPKFFACLGIFAGVCGVFCLVDILLEYLFEYSLVTGILYMFASAYASAGAH